MRFSYTYDTISHNTNNCRRRRERRAATDRAVAPDKSRQDDYTYTYTMIL